MTVPIPAPEMATSPAINQTPPDVRPRTLAEILSEADAMIWRDGGMDESEMALVRAFYEQQQQKIMALQAQQQAQQQGQQPMAGNEEADYTEGGDAEREDYFG